MHCVPQTNKYQLLDYLNSPVVKNFFFFGYFIAALAAYVLISYACAYMSAALQKNFLVKSILCVNAKLMSLYEGISPNSSLQNSNVILKNSEELGNFVYTEPVTKYVFKFVTKTTDGLSPGLYVNVPDWGWKIFPEFLQDYSKEILSKTADPAASVELYSELSSNLVGIMS